MLNLVECPALATSTVNSVNVISVTADGAGIVTLLNTAPSQHLVSKYFVNSEYYREE